jgi:hypothetical protein
MVHSIIITTRNKLDLTIWKDKGISVW